MLWITLTSKPRGWIVDSPFFSDHGPFLTRVRFLWENLLTRILEGANRVQIHRGNASPSSSTLDGIYQTFVVHFTTDHLAVKLIVNTSFTSETPSLTLPCISNPTRYNSLESASPRDNFLRITVPPLYPENAAQYAINATSYDVDSP